MMAKGDYNWLVGAGLGFVMGGPIGGIVGAILGSQVSKVAERFRGQGGVADSRTGSRDHYTGGLEGDLIVSFLVLSAAITKADEQVLASEVRLLKDYLVRSFGVSRGAVLMKMYKEILDKPMDVDAVCAQIRDEADPAFKRTVLQVLFEIALADSDLARSEMAMLERIARGMGLGEAEYRAMAAQYGAHAPDRDYELLELTNSASEEEIKTKYRELVKKYHPDKVSHLGAEFKELAEKKFKEVSAAYERIKKAKGIA